MLSGWGENVLSHPSCNTSVPSYIFNINVGKKKQKNYVDSAPGKLQYIWKYKS